MENKACCRIFLLSPAYAGGQRARMILSDRAQFELARKLRGKKGAPIAEVFTFLSGLYFRGKIAYATAFTRPARSELPVSLSLRPRAGLSMQKREFISTTCVSLPRSTFTRTIRVIEYRLSATHNFWQRSYHSRARSFFSAALPRVSMLMF